MDIRQKATGEGLRIEFDWKGHPVSVTLGETLVIMVAGCSTPIGDAVEPHLKKNRVEFEEDFPVLSERNIESLRQYSDACKMRPNEYPDQWRSVPTSKDEVYRSGNWDYWLSIANSF